MTHELKETDNQERLWARRWGVTLRTVKNWIEKAQELGGLVPFESENPNDLVEWYRVAFGKAPKGEIEARARELRIEMGLEVVDQVEIDLGPIEVIKKALERVGMDLTFSRIVEEEERAAKMYEVLRVRGVSTSEARRQWKEASEMKRAAQKGDDAVQVARELLREWVLKEFEPVQRDLRKKISGSVLGVQARQGLIETVTDKEWERVWDKELEKVLSEK
jgi:hypothetical protein